MNLGKLNHLIQSTAEETTDRVLKAISSKSLRLHTYFVLQNCQEKNQFSNVLLTFLYPEVMVLQQ